MSLITATKKIDKEYFEELGFGYLTYDWKNLDELVNGVTKISRQEPMSFRVINMNDDAYHLVFARHPFSVREARDYIKIVNE